MASRLVQSTCVQQATPFALLTCSAPVNQARMSIETTSMQAPLRDIDLLGAFRLFVSICQLSTPILMLLPVTTPSRHHLRLRYALACHPEHDNNNNPASASGVPLQFGRQDFLQMHCPGPYATKERSSANPLYARRLYLGVCKGFPSQSPGLSLAPLHSVLESFHFCVSRPARARKSR